MSNEMCERCKTGPWGNLTEGFCGMCLPSAVRDLKLQNSEMRQLLWDLWMYIHEPNIEGIFKLPGDLNTRLASFTVKRKDHPQNCKVCKSEIPEEAWSGICGDCQDSGHRP